MRENEIVSIDTVVKEYGISEPLAREIVMEETRQALLRSWPAWLIFLAALAIAGYIFSTRAAGNNSVIWILLGTLVVWFLVGRYLAGPAIRKAAKEKAARLQELHS